MKNAGKVSENFFCLFIVEKVFFIFVLFLCYLKFVRERGFTEAVRKSQYFWIKVEQQPDRCQTAEKQTRPFASY